MNLSEPFIRRPVMTILVTLTFSILGIVSYFVLPVSDMPNVDFPAITVTASYPGSSPENMANNVAMPLEKEFVKIAGLRSLTSTNTQGSSQVVLEFDIQKSMDSAALDVESAISRARPNLPPDLPIPPTFEKVNPSDTPILYMAVTSESLDLAEIYKYAYTFIGQKLSMIEGVAKILTYGSPYAIRVKVDPEELAAINLSLNEVGDVVRRATPDLPTGQFDGVDTTFVIYADGKLENAEQFNNEIVRYNGTQALKIADIGHAVDGLQNDRFTLKYYKNHKTSDAVVIAVQKQAGANTVALSHRIRQYLPELVAQLPGSVQLDVVYDKSYSIEDSIDEVQLTLIVALILVVLVIFLYLGSPMDTLIPSISMPITILMTFWFMEIFGFSLNNLSLLALILATGFIVDDAIVVLENIVHHVEKGLGRFKATMEGSKLIAFTILSMNFSLAAVFIPFLYMGGVIGKVLHEFSVTTIITIFASCFISLTLTPMMCTFLLPERKKGEKKSYLAEMSERVNNWGLSIYEKGLHFALAHKKSMLLFGFVNIILSAVCFSLLPQEFFPEDDIGFVMAFTETQQGTSPDKMDELQGKVSQVFFKNSGIEHFVAIAGNPQINQGIAFLSLAPRKERVSAPVLIQSLYPELLSIPGINTFLKNIPLINLSVGSMTRGTYQYTLQSMDIQDLYQSAEKFLESMQANPIFQGVNSDLQVRTPQINIHILRDKASSLGVDPQQIEETLLLAYSGNRVVRISTPYDQYDVIVETTKPYRQNPIDLDSLYVKSTFSSNLIPLTALVEWDEGVGTASVNHTSQFPSVTIAYNLAPGASLDVAEKALNEITKAVVPTNVLAFPVGAGATFSSSINEIFYLTIVACLVIYVVLGILYESFIHPITILSTLPPAILGGLATLVIFNLPMSLYGYLGIILLIGIVKKNGIMIVDYALENRKQKHESTEKAVIEACLVRFRPIMMTTLSAIMGALPIIFAMGAGAEGRRSLGYVIVGGLVFSQFVTLLLTPVIYCYFDRLQQWMEKKVVVEGSE